MLGDAFTTTQVQGFLSLEDCENSIWDYASASKGLNLTGLLPRWRAELTAQLQAALPLFRSGALAGVFLGDEMMCSKIPYSNYSAVASATRQWLRANGLADALIYSNECSTPLVREGEVWSMPDKLPEELDLFSCASTARTPPPLAFSPVLSILPYIHAHGQLRWPPDQPFATTQLVA